MPTRSRRSLAWAGYAASGWAIAYAVLVRGYQGLGGTVGLAGTFEDPEGMRRASLLAGARMQHTLPDLHPARTIFNRLWPLLVCTLGAGVLSIFAPQIGGIARQVGDDARPAPAHQPPVAADGHRCAMRRLMLYARCDHVVVRRGRGWQAVVTGVVGARSSGAADSTAALRSNWPLGLKRTRYDGTMASRAVDMPTMWPPITFAICTSAGVS